MSNQILTLSYHLLFFLTPLVWFPLNHELFEYNKMMLVYLLTIIATTAWVWKMIQAKELIFKRTPLDIPLGLFLVSQIISTYFSLDSHTSWWGYYSRSNGGLWSIISYLLLYWAYVSNFDQKLTLNFLKSALFGGAVVSLWAIPEHFGVSPSCVFLTGQFSSSCWVQDVQARVFATLGQPNWLAAYLGMLIFPAIYFLLTAQNRISAAGWWLLVTGYYLAFTFTYSRSATLGLMVGLAALFLSHARLGSHPEGGIKLALSVLAGFLLVNLLFGSALTDFKLISQFSPPSRPTVSLTPAPSATQLETGGTESGKIRLIVWKGAWDIFQNYPLFGSGVETFAHAYYRFRPVEHNLVSEWDFLYNKAHNEYLNYLATTGIMGLGSYLAIILTFIAWSVRRIYQQKQNPAYYLLHITFLASYLANLVTNFFGFSVVVTNLFFFLFPAFSLVASGEAKNYTLTVKLPSLAKLKLPRPIYQGVVLLLAVILFLTIIRFWIGDLAFNRGYQATQAGNVGTAYNELLLAVSLNPGEPLYRSELGYAAASAALGLVDQDSTASAKFKNLAVTETNYILSKYPQNTTLYRNGIRTYFILSQLDQSLTQKTLEVVDQTIKLSPTDAKLQHIKATILGFLGKEEEAKEALRAAIKLKPNYPEVQEALGKFNEKGR